uniref:Annexin n=1 Tax=Ephydatia fluviatilis TaxID=31330 RepID=Q4W6D6_9METZ|nr:annexin [Ephydatia fluviatilis]
MAQAQQYNGTVQPAAHFDAEADAAALRKAMKGVGTDEAAIINVIAHRSNAQRQELKLKYKLLHGRDLIEDLHSELSGHFRSAVLALMETKAVYDAHCLRNAMKGLGTDESVLIEILGTRTNQEIKDIVAAYSTVFKRNLEKDVVSETSGNFKRLLVSLCQGARDESLTVDHEKAKREAQELYEAGEKHWGTDESKFNFIIASRSLPQLKATFEEYAKVAKRDIISSIGREMSGDVKRAFQTAAQCAYARPAYFAERLHHSMKGAGTDDDTLVRLVVTRSEIDLAEIKRVFLAAYGKTLTSWIEADVSGDYRKLLVAIVGPN